MGWPRIFCNRIVNGFVVFDWYGCFIIHPVSTLFCSRFCRYACGVFSYYAVYFVGVEWGFFRWKLTGVVLKLGSLMVTLTFLLLVLEPFYFRWVMSLAANWGNAAAGTACRRYCSGHGAGPDRPFTTLSLTPLTFATPATACTATVACSLFCLNNPGGHQP